METFITQKLIQVKLCWQQNTVLNHNYHSFHCSTRKASRYTTNFSCQHSCFLFWANE